MMRFTLILIGLIICQFGNTQEKDNKHFLISAKTGFAGYFGAERLSDFATSKAGPKFAVAFGYQHALSRKGNLSAQIHLQYAYAQFTSLNTISDFASGTFKSKVSYESQYLQVPFYLGLRSKKFTFSLGLSPTFHLQTKGIFEDSFTNTSGVTSRSKLVNITGQKNSSTSLDRYEWSIDNNFELQALLNLSYQIKDWSIGLEITHFLKDNFFVTESDLFDVPRVFIDYDQLQRRSILLAFSKRI